MAIEEFVEGHEGFYDTLTVDGRVAHDFVSHYYPERARGDAHALDLAADRRDQPHGRPTATTRSREMGRRVSAALGIDTAATHMEWFFGPKGLQFSEIGCRPPGVGQWDSYCAGNEFDLYREWALAVCYGVTDRRAVAALRLRHHRAPPRPRRPDRRLRGHRRDLPPLPRPGRRQLLPARRARPTQPVAAGYMANAWMRVRHPDYDELRRILNEIGERVRVRAH